MAPAPKLSETELAAKYGYAAVFFNMHPELKNLLQQAVRGQWTAEQFSARFMNTQWYKKNSEPFKEWKALIAKNPGEANRQLAVRQQEISDAAARMGVTIDFKRVHLLATNSLMLGWDERIITRALASEMQYKPDKALGGDAGAASGDIKEMAAAYGVTLGDKDIFSMTQKQMMGTLSQEGIEEYVKNLAKSRYPGLADEIDKGLSLREVASAYVQSQSRILEINPDQIDLGTDRNLQKALQYVDPATGKPGGAMPLWQYEEQLRKDSRWLATDNAHEEVVGVGTKILKDFGLIT